MPRRQFLIVALPVLLVACNSSEEAAAPAAEQAAPPAPVLTPAAVATTAPDGSALIAGSWYIKEDATGASAGYGGDEQDTQLSIQCDPASRSLTLAIQAETSAPEAWRLDAGGEAARIDLTPDGNEVLPYLIGQVDQNLSIINALGQQGQVFTLTSPAGQPSQFPTHPGIRRVIDSCR